MRSIILTITHLSQEKVKISSVDLKRPLYASETGLRDPLNWWDEEWQGKPKYSEKT
jgi:hypothetical protein